MPSSTSSSSAASAAAAAAPPPAPAVAPRVFWRVLRVALPSLALVGWAAFLVFGLRARISLSSVMLFLTGAALLGSCWWLYRTVAALAVDPPMAATRLGGAARRELERDKRNLLKAIKELEFDHSMGKLSDADFQELVRRYRHSAVAVMRRLDEGAVTYRALIDREVQQRVGTAAAGPAAPEGARVCPACARANDDDAAFCKGCGCRLDEVPL
jgi:hypothetical protein